MLFAAAFTELSLSGAEKAAPAAKEAKTTAKAPAKKAPGPKAAAKKPACEENIAEIIKKGTHFHAI